MSSDCYITFIFARSRMTLAVPRTLLPHNLPRSLKLRVPNKAARDLWNRLRFGADAPLSDECLIVPTSEVRLRYLHRGTAELPRFRRRHSGLVMGGDWDLSVAPIGGELKEAACRAHFLGGVPWEATELFTRLARELREKGEVDGCRSLAELRARYEVLDRIYDEARRTGRLRAQRELSGYFRREYGGIFVHVGRDGRLLRSSGGAHRFAIARILALPRIPVQVGVVHPEAVTRGLYRALREGRQP